MMRSTYLCRLVQIAQTALGLLFVSKTMTPECRRPDISICQHNLRIAFDIHPKAQAVVEAQLEVDSEAKKEVLDARFCLLRGFSL